MRFQREVPELHAMILTAVVKLSPSSEQRQLLYQTLAGANQACNAISSVAWGDKVFHKFDLHKLTYKVARGEFGLAAQLAIRCVAKVADAYKADQRTKRQFKKLGAIAYDSRILNFRMSDQTVSLWLIGRQAGDALRVWRETGRAAGLPEGRERPGVPQGRVLPVRSL